MKLIFACRAAWCPALGARTHQLRGSSRCLGHCRRWLESVASRQNLPPVPHPPLPVPLLYLANLAHLCHCTHTGTFICLAPPTQPLQSILELVGLGQQHLRFGMWEQASGSATVPLAKSKAHGSSDTTLPTGSGRALHLHASSSWSCNAHNWCCSLPSGCSAIRIFAAWRRRYSLAFGTSMANGGAAGAASAGAAPAGALGTRSSGAGSAAAAQAEVAVPPTGTLAFSWALRGSDGPATAAVAAPASSCGK